MAVPRLDSGTRFTTRRAKDGRRSENAAPIARAPAIATGSDCGEHDRDEAGGFDDASADDAGNRPVAVRQPAAEEPGEEHGRREGGEHLRSVADVALVQVEDEERRDRREAHCAEREPHPGHQALALDPGPALTGLGLGDRVRLGDPPGDDGPEEGRGHRKGPDHLEARGPQKQLADRRTQREAAPDRQAVEADDPAPLLNGREVDDPSGPGGIDQAFARAKEQAGHDQAGNAGGNEVEGAGDRAEDRPGDHDGPPAAAIGEVAGDRPAGKPGDREGASDEPDREVTPADRPLHVARDDGQGRSDREQAEPCHHEDSCEGGTSGRDPG